MQKRHKLLDRQIARLLEAQDQARLASFLEAVAQTYQNFEDDYALLERSMELSSNELFEANEKMRAQHTQMIISAKLTELGRMAGGIAHEINTPLGIIALSSEMIRQICLDPLPNLEELVQLASNIEDTSKRIAKIVLSLRHFSREGDSDKTASASLREIVSDTLLLCDEKFRQHQIEIRIQIPEDIKIDCRAFQISQVLLNLLNNSYDAIVSDSPQWVVIEARDLDASTEISVTDSGPGLAPEVVKNLFMPFFTTKEVGAGSGLGLSASMGIVEAHGGTLKVDAACPNTRFVMSFPRRFDRK